MASSIIGSAFQKRRSSAWESQLIACRHPLECVPTWRRCSLCQMMGMRSFVLAWCISGEAIGQSSLKDIVPGNFGNMHLHMWRPDLRGKGHGPHLFCLAAVDFYERFKLT
jgi:RimJ/RimL family protein N-acetyltransferase